MNKVFANAQRACFGQSCEKQSYVLNEGQMGLFNEVENCQNHKSEETAEETFTIKAHARKKKRTMDEREKDLPVDKVLLKLSESRLVYGKCGRTFKPIG